jgi:hypothetical protein
MNGKLGLALVAAAIGALLIQQRGPIRRYLTMERM